MQQERMCIGLYKNAPQPHRYRRERIRPTHTHSHASTHAQHIQHALVIDDSNLSLTFSVKEVESQGLGVGVLKQETQDGY